MKLTASLVLGILATAGFGVACAIADTTAGETNLATVITNRNVLHLQPPAAPATPQQKTVEVPKLMLSGFYKVGTNSRVLLVMPPKDQNSVTKYFNLAPGEKDTPVEVVKINAEKGEVEIINSGRRMTVSLASNGVVATAATNHPAGGLPPLPGTPGGQQARTWSPFAAAASAAPSGNSALVLGGGDFSSLSQLGNGFSLAGALGAGRNAVSSGNSGALAGSGNGSSTGGVIVGGGNSAGAITFNGANNSAAAAGASTGPVYVPPYSGSTVVNPAAPLVNPFWNPQNTWQPTPPTVLPGSRQ